MPFRKTASRIESSRTTKIWLLLWVGFTACTIKPHPSDEDLILRFDSCRPALEQVVRMLQDDGVKGVLKDRQVDSLPSERYSEYERAFDLIGTDAIVRDEDCFVMTVSGFGVGTTSYKGFAYCTSEPAPMFDSLNSLPRALPTDTLAFRRIEENWYIFLWWDD